MKPGKPFIDTNVLLYLLSPDDARADRAEEAVAGGGVISVQVLSEFVPVNSRMRSMSPECLAVAEATPSANEFASLAMTTYARARVTAV
jgi:predicted nucleic acid-binding protein